MRNKLVYGVFAVVLVLVGWFALAQTPPGTVYEPPGEWKMHSHQGGATFIYNPTTGIIYRIYTGCGDDEPDGCVSGPLPIETTTTITVDETGEPTGLDANAFRFTH